MKVYNGGVLYALLVLKSLGDMGMKLPKASMKLNVYLIAGVM